MPNYISTTLNPNWYHGAGKKRPFFEGWYYKLIDESGTQKWAVIPGVFLSQAPHAFIQLLNGTTAETYYFEYPIDSFWSAADQFDVKIGPNRFSDRAIRLNIEAGDQKMAGEVRFSGLTPWPVTLRSPGIMGWYAWLPTMECYHGVVSLDHSLQGELVWNDTPIRFKNGRGYIEKDWGRSFPSAYIWMQSNHFDSVGTSLTASIAMIPWRKTAFRGFIVGLWHNHRLYRFATYTGAETESLSVTDDDIIWTMRDKRFRLILTAHRGESAQFGLLKGPSTVEMGKRIAESLTATIQVRLIDIKNQEAVIFEGSGRHAGLEVYNAVPDLIK